jgi:hypothetical protein
MGLDAASPTGAAWPVLQRDELTHAQAGSGVDSWDIFLY